MSVEGAYMVGPNFGRPRFGTKLGDSGPEFDDGPLFWREAAFGRNRPSWVNFDPSVAEIGPNLVELGQVWFKVGR